MISNHGGRQIDALPAAINALPAIAAQVGSRTTVMWDSGVRSGVDVARALALGASAAFAGKAFLWGLAALGEDGPPHVIDLLTEELKATLGQVGAGVADARAIEVRHCGALQFGTTRPG
jgi:(S)-mandelate dehydrogenase